MKAKPTRIPGDFERFSLRVLEGLQQKVYPETMEFPCQSGLPIRLIYRDGTYREIMTSDLYPGTTRVEELEASLWMTSISDRNRVYFLIQEARNRAEFLDRERWEAIASATFWQRVNGEKALESSQT